MPSSSHLAHILRELGWNEGFTVPIASAENHALECEIQKREEELETTQKCLAVNTERISILSQHHDDVEHELHHTMYLLQARKKELSTEEHMTILAKQQRDRYQREIVKLDKEYEKLKESGNLLKNTVFQRKEKLGRLKSRLNWDTDTLEAWLVECKQKEEDFILINKFSAQDEDVIKELNTTIKRMSDELVHLQKSLDWEYIEAQSLEMELNKTAEVFRLMHADRSHLLSRWERMLKQMLAKDSHIQTNAVKLFDASEEARELKRLLKQKENLYNMLIEDTANIQTRTDAIARKTASLKLDLQNEEKLRAEFHAELKALEMAIVKTSGKLNLERSETSQLGISVNKKLSELQTIKKKCDRSKLKLSIISESAVSAEEEMKQMNELYLEDSRFANGLSQELEELRLKHHQANSDRQEKLMQEQTLNMEIGKASGQLKKLNSQLTFMSAIDVRQQKILHSKEIELNDLTWRMDRMKGELSSKSETAAMERKIRELTKELKLHTNTRQILTKQQKQQQVEFSNIHQAMKEFSSEKTKILDMLKEMDLCMSDARRELEKLTVARQNLLVELNVFELKVQYKKQRLSRRASGVELLESDRITIEATIKEHLMDISDHQALLKQSIRMMDQERQKIVFQLHEKIAQVERLKYRFEISVIPFAPESGGDHDAARLNYFMMKVVLEREELKREGDCLDARIRKASKELEALKNTVTILNYQNSAARQSLRPVAKDGEAMEVKEQLEKELRGLMIKLKQKQKQVHDIRTDYQVICQTAANLRHEKENLATTVKEKKIKFCQVKKEFDCCEARLQRADQQQIRLSREIRAGCKIIHKLPEEVDIDIRELRELNKNAIQKMKEVIEKHPEMAADVEEMLSRASIPMSFRSSSSYSSCSSSSLSVRSSPESSMQPTLSGVKKKSSVNGRSSSSSKSSSSSSDRNHKV